MLITGLRGVGKTVLLTAFEDIAIGQGWRYAFREMGPTTELVGLLPRIVRTMLNGLSPSRRLRAKAIRVLQGLGSFVVTTPDGFELAVRTDDVHPEERVEDLTEIFVLLGELAIERNTGVAFLFDEMQFLAPDDFEAFVAALHRCVQLALPVVYVGAGLPQLPKLAGEAKSYAERIFSYQPIGRLDEPAARAAIVEPARRYGVTYEDAALERVLEMADGYPFFIQHYGKFAWLRAEGSERITRRDVDEAVELGLKSLDEGFFQARFQRTSPNERRYMEAMADLGDAGPYKSGGVARALEKTTRDVSVVRDSLVKKGLVYAPPGEYGYVDFTVPHFAGFLKRQSR